VNTRHPAVRSILDVSEIGVPRAPRSEAAAFWWVYLVLGAGWLLFAIIIFRFDWTSVSSISILFGAAMLAAGVAELAAIGGASRGWRIAHALAGLAFVVIGVVAFVHPGDTFSALAGVMSFYFVLKGMFDLALALGAMGTRHWWLRLLVGVAEILLGFWAAGDFGHKTVLLLVWIGAAALTHGIMDIVAAFELRASARG
jgi:uncharacterized membrane protein HdeD (DUF308 family)